MLNVKGCLVLAGMILFSCAAKEKAPAGVLGSEEMVRVLSEVLVTEEKVNKLGLNSDSAYQVFTELKGKVFEKVGVPDSVFKRSMDYYINHPKEMEKIYTALVDSLNLKEQRASVRKEKE